MWLRVFPEPAVQQPARHHGFLVGRTIANTFQAFAAKPGVDVSNIVISELPAWPAQSMGMHAQRLGYPSIWAFIPVYWCASIYKRKCPYIYIYIHLVSLQCLGMHPHVLGGEPQLVKHTAAAPAAAAAIAAAATAAASAAAAADMRQQHQQQKQQLQQQWP